jgi:hypothetical protein
VTLRSQFDCSLLMLLTVLSRYATRSSVLYDLDSVNFALALDHFDPGGHQPHPPGYFLYIVLGRFARLVTGDANAAFVAISITASAVAVFFIYQLAYLWAGRRAAAAAGILFLVSPLAWFHGTVALTYIVEAMFSAMAGYFCWKAFNGSRHHGLAAAIVVGVAAGFRQSSALFLAPLLFFSCYALGPAVIARVIGVLSLVVTAWMLPMFYQAGGVAHYFEVLTDLWTVAPGRVVDDTSGIVMIVARCLTVALILLLAMGPAALFIGVRATLPSLQRRFMLVWIIPALLFFTLVFLKFVNSGYLLLITPPMFAALGNRAAVWIDRNPSPFRRIAVACLVLIVGIGTYIKAPFYCSYSSVKKFERDLVMACKVVRAKVTPSDTLILGFDSHFLGYRHAAFYLPEFTVLQYPEVKMRSGTKVFAVRKGRTELLTRLPGGDYRQIALFPMPDEPQYRAHIDAVMRKLSSRNVSGSECVGEKVCTLDPQSLESLFTIPVH